jgi:hypothetical protein
MCRSNVTYVRAAVTLLRAQDAALTDRVNDGDVRLLDAAASVRRRVKLVEAFRDAAPDDLAAFARTIGPGVLFDSAISPVIA